MAIGANGGTVAVQLELFGVKEAESKLKRFERTVKTTFDKSKRAAASFGNAIKKSFANVRKALQNSFANKAVAAGLFAVFVDGTRKALKLERTMLSLNRSLGANGARAFDFATKAAKKYGLGLTDTVDSFSKFTAAATAANIPLQTQEELFDAVTKSAVTFGMTAEETRGAFQALQQMASKGVVSMEELRQQLGERVPIATAAAAKGFGVSAAELIKMVESGKLAANEFFPALTKGLNELSSGEIETLSVQIGRLKNSWEEFTINLGENFAVPMLDWLVKRTNEFVSNLKEAGARFKLFGLGSTSGGLFGGGAFSDRAGVAFKQVDQLQKIFGKYGLTQEKAIKAYKQAVDEGNEAGGVAAAERSFDIAKAMTDEEYKRQQIQQDALKDAERLEKLSKIRSEVAKETAKIEKESAKFQAEQAKKRDQFISGIVSDRIGSEAGNAYAAQQVLKRAREERNQARRAARSAGAGDLSTSAGQIALARATAEYNRKSSVYLQTGQESAYAIQQAFAMAKQSAEDAADAVGKAKESYAGFLVDPSKGIGRYMGGAGNQRRQEAGRQLLLSRARDIRSSILPTIKNYNDQDSFRANTKLSTFSVQELQEFINSAGGELEAQRSLTKANEDLTKANHELSEVMKVAADNQVPLNESNAALNETINELINKDWTVNVEVPGGSASGDVVALQNSLQ